MLEVLLDEAYSSGSEADFTPSPSAQPQPDWQRHVTDELTALHSALEGRARALNERESALAAREAEVGRRELQLAKDEGLLRQLLHKEAERLQREAQV